MARGPAYPYINLEQAVELSRQLYDYAKRTPANLEAVMKEKWGYSLTSSSAGKLVAALKYYGLADVFAGEKDKGDTIKISDRAYRILVDEPESAERKQALKDAFLSPKAYKLCWDKWGTELPPSMKSTLIFQEGFVETTVDAFLTNYKKSLEFAGLSESDKQDANSPAGAAGNPNGAGVQFTPPPTPAPTPAPAGGAGVGAAVGRTPAAIPPKGVGMRQEVFALAEGDVTIQWPEQLSPDSFQDFTDWLKLLERRIKRSVQTSTPTPPAVDLSDAADSEEL
jgi:hypothetical protein